MTTVQLGPLQDHVGDELDTTAGAPPSGAHDLPRTPTERVASWLMKIVAALVLAFLVLPILVVIIESFNKVNYLVFPIKGFSLDHYRGFFADDTWMAATTLSLRLAAVSAAIATVLGTMAAWGLRRVKGRGRAVAFGLLYSPAIVPIIVLAMGYYFFLARFHLIGNWLAISAAYAVLGLPFVLVAVSSALEHFDPEVENAARTLGAGPVRTLWHITFPQITSGIVVGAIFAFVSAFDEAVIILFVSGSGSVTLPRKLWDSVRYDLTPTLAVAGTLLITTCVILFTFAEVARALRERKYTA